MSQVASRVRLAKIGKYEILEKIGAGGHGKVYKGRDPESREIVAIKLVPMDVASDRELGMRFAQECQVSKQLQHTHIVRVLDFGLDGWKPFLVMEYVDGESLRQRLDREGRILEAEAVRLLAQIGQALEWTHQRRVIHRDIKPDNILITKRGEAKLTDFGIAKNLKEDVELTRPLCWLGTPYFTAPEQLLDAKRADALCDLYSLAATLYMALTGEVPFGGTSPGAIAMIYQKKLKNDIAPPRQRVPQVSERVNAAVLSALRAERRERPSSIAAFLQSVRSDDGAAQRPDAPLPAARPTAHERRSRQRRPCSKKITCQPMERGISWKGKVTDISQGGLCLELSRRFEPGAILQVSLPLEHTDERRVVVRVVWVEKEKKKSAWRLGCQFDQLLCDFELHELQ